jgi:hypothetical protein
MLTFTTIIRAMNCPFTINIWRNQQIS